MRFRRMTEAERHLKGNFRLSCQTYVTGGSGHVRCHTMRRGHMRIERQAFGLPVSHGALQLDPAVTRDGDRILIDGVEVERSTGPIHGIAMDLGTTTVVLRLFDLESGELIADTSFENPQRFGGSDVMSRIAYDTEPSREAADAHAGRLPEPRDREVPRRSEDHLRDGGGGQLHDARSVLPAKRVLDRADPVPVDHRNRNGARASATTTSLVQTGLRSLLPIHPKARVYGAPIISGHVGADAAACMLAVDLAHEDRLVAVMDIGTNTELIVGNKASHSRRVVPGRAGLRRRSHRLRHAGAGRRDRRSGDRRRRQVSACA